MTPITTTRAVNAPPAAVFAEACNIEGAPAHIPGLLRIEHFGPRPLQRGTRWLETRRTPSGPRSFQVEITAFEPGRSYTSEWSMLGARFRARLDVEPAPGDPARATIRMHTAAEPAGLRSRLLLALARPALSRVLRTDLDAIARAAEAHAARAPDA